MVKVELFECLDAVERDAAGALDRERQPVLFDRLSWYRLLQQYCRPPGKLLVARAQDANGGRSWLFLTARRRRARALANWYTLRYGAVHDGEAEPEREIAIAAALRRRGLSSIDLHPLSAESQLPARFGRAGWRAVAGTANANWVADVAGLSFADYWANRPARLRNTGGRKSKSSGLACRVFNRFDAEAWRAYEAVYDASWKTEEGSPAFLRALAEQEGAAGTLRLGIARLDDRPVAAQFWLVEQGRATIHKLAYRQDAKRYSPGTMLSMAVFRHAIDVDRVALIDFGLGDDSFKADWMDRRQTTRRMTAYNLRTPAGLAGAARETAAALVRRVRSH